MRTNAHTIIRQTDGRIMWTFSTRDEAFNHMAMMVSGSFKVIAYALIGETVKREDRFGLGTYLVSW